MKKVLSINYSQSGQLDQILTSFLEPFQGCDIDIVKFEPAVKYPFPWTSETFFDVMPDTVLEVPIELAPYSLKYESYDLIVIGNQPWFLSPSLPIISLLKQEGFRKVLKNTPVVTVIGARNMWLNSQDSIVREITEAGGVMVGNVPFIDKVQNHISALTILHWMSTGTKTRRWGFLPLPGVSERDISEGGKFGKPVAEALKDNDFSGLQDKILAVGGIHIQASIMLIEARAKKFFKVWANLITTKGDTPAKKAKWVKRFEWYLIIALFVVSPPILIINFVLRPIFWSKIKRSRRRWLYLGIN